MYPFVLPPLFFVLVYSLKQHNMLHFFHNNLPIHINFCSIPLFLNFHGASTFQNSGSFSVIWGEVPADYPLLLYKTLKSHLRLYLWSILPEQVRESIGVTLSVLCSNIRLHASFSHDHLHQTGASSSDMQPGGSWDRYLIEQASELVLNLQNISVSETMEFATNKISDNGTSIDHSQDDIKWMETVFIYQSTWSKLNDLL